MDKDGGEGGACDGGGGKGDASLLDAASLFGAYWGRDGAGAAGAAAAQQQQAAAAAQLFGFQGGAAAARGYPPSSATLSVAASQAASLGLHPAASAAWWQMASHLAAQDYLARIQASGLNFPPMGDPYSALSALSGGSLGALGSGGGKSSSKGSKGKVGERSGRNSSSSVGSSSSSKEKSPATSMGGSQNARSSYGFPKTSSPSMMHSSSQSASSMSGMSLPPSLAGLNSLVTGGKSAGMPGPSNGGGNSKHGRKSSSKSPGMGGGGGGGGGSLKERELALLRGDLLLAQAAAQGAYQAAVVAANKGNKNSSSPFGLNNPFGVSGGMGSDKDRHSGLDMANLPHTILGDPSSVLGGVRLPPDTEIIKYTSSISGPKVRKSSGGSSRGRKKTISLDPPHVSVLPSSVGSSLPPKRQKLESDYSGVNSSCSGQPLSAHGGSRDRVEVIRLPSRNETSTPHSALEDYSAGLSRELLQSIASQSGLSLAALERQLAGPNPTGLNLSGKSLSGRAVSSPADSTQPLDLGKNSSNNANRAHRAHHAHNDDDAPLNLSLKPSASESTTNSWDWHVAGGGVAGVSVGSGSGSDAISRLTSLSSSLSAPPPTSDRVSRRKPGAKPRRVIQECSLSPPPTHPHSAMPPTDDSPRPKSSGSEDSEMASSSLCAAGGGSSSSSREGRPRNLGRGVSKPKKNTVASLLAQSRALGLRPALAQQLLQEADLEKLKAVLGEASSFSEAQISGAGAMSTDSEYVSDSDLCPSDSDASEIRDAPSISSKAGGRRRRGAAGTAGEDYTHLRVPMALGWKRDTVMKGLSRSGYIKGDVCYTPPEPHSSVRLTNVQELLSYLEKHPCPPLSRDNFSFSSRILVGTFLQAAPPGLGLPTTNVDGVDYILMPEAEVAKRLEEARALTALGMGVGVGPRPLPPPPLDRRMELARQQQAARDAKRDATARGRQQARFVRELERSEKAEHAKREKEARNQQLLEIPMRRSQLTIQPLTQSTAAKQKSTVPEVSVWRTGEGNPQPVKTRTMAPISLTLIPVNSKDMHSKAVSPVKTINLDSSGWKNEIEQYNALDKMMSFAENAGFDYPKKTSVPSDIKYDFDLTIVKAESSKNLKVPTKTKATNKIILNASLSEVASRITKSEVSLDEQKEQKLLDLLRKSYSRMDEFTKGCSWTDNKIDENVARDPHELEKSYLKAKKQYMTEICHLKESATAMQTVLPNVTEEKINVVEIIDLSVEDEVLKKVQKSGVQTYTLGKDGAISVSVHRRTKNSSPVRVDNLSAKRKKQEEAEKLRLEEQTRKAQEREMKRQHAVMMKEQERERRRQHTALVRQLETRRRWEERERRKHQILMDRLLGKEKRMQERRCEMELLAELRRPQEDSTLSDQKPLPALNRIPGLKLSGEAMADIMMVFEFIHNFGQTLGFDMETLPSLNTLQMALLPDSCPDAEEELLTVLQHLLVCAIEDPGIPHPGRHTTLLGQAIRLGDINTGNISEILRIYLYANSTGEVKALTGISQEREREKRVADHHQTEEEMRTTCNSGGRNAQYYEHLRANPTYRLAELLRDKPFLALSGAAKARTLAHLCNELLQNRAVLRQIDASLEHLNQLRKERYLMEAKLRKLRGIHTRKQRAEATERQQTLAIERMQRLVEESQTGVDCKKTDVDGDSLMAPPLIKDNGCKQDMKDLEKPLLLDKDSVTGDEPMMLSDAESEGTQPEEDEDKNLSSEELGRKLERLLKQSEQQLQSLTAGAHSLRATCYGQDRYWRRYWSLGKCGGIFVEGMESAQPEILTYHEALESGERQKIEDGDKRKRDIDTVKRGRRSRARKGQKEKSVLSETSSETGDKEVNVKTEDQIKSEMELKSIKSELNLSDHTQIIKYEPNVRAGHCKLEGSPIKMEERYIQQKQSKQAEDMLDIEDSIPTAFLVQKPSLNNHNYQHNNQMENVEKVEVKGEVVDVKSEAIVKNETNEPDLTNSVKKEAQLNNLEELKKLADSVSQKEEISETNSQNDSLECKEVTVKKEMSPADKVEQQQQVNIEMATLMLYNKMLEGKWFSILRREHALVANATNGQIQPDGVQSVSSSPEKNDKQLSEGLNGVNGTQTMPTFYNRNTTCAQVITCQGHNWEVSNNLHLLSNPGLLLGNPSQAITLPSAPSVYADSSMTMSGLQQDVMDASLALALNVTVKSEDEAMDICDNDIKDEDCDNSAEEKVIQDSTLQTTVNHIKTEIKRERESSYYNNVSASNLASLNYVALTAYVSCDSPPPLQLSAEESEQLEQCKTRGLPPKVEGNFVPRELRHGWWRITDSECLRELLESLHPRGVRERELQAALLAHPVLHSSNKLSVDLAATELSISHLDRVIALNGGYPASDSITAYSNKTARRLRQQVMQKVESLEEAVVAASIQVKGWRPTRNAAVANTTTTSPAPHDDGAALVMLARARLAELEANIERRYLNPPLGHSTGDANIGAVLQAESHGATPTQSPSTGSSSQSSECGSTDSKGVPRGLSIWREAAARCQSSAQVAMVLQALKSAIAWDRSVMTANCQFCLSGDSEDKLLICDGCDKGYHTYCFKPKMDKIPEGDWYCWECVNKATGERACIVCGGTAGSVGGRGRLVPCALCARAYHQDCHVPPLGKVPRGKWYCVNCIAKAPPKKPRSTSKKKDPRHSKEALDSSDHQMVPSPAQSLASTSTTADDSSSINLSTQPPTPLFPMCANLPTTPDKQPHTPEQLAVRTEYEDASVTDINGRVASAGVVAVDLNHMLQEHTEVNQTENGLPGEHFQADEPMHLEPENGSADNGTLHERQQEQHGHEQEQEISENVEETKSLEDLLREDGIAEEIDTSAVIAENNTSIGRPKKEKSSAKRLQKDLNVCKSLLDQMEIHEDAWPFLLPVNTKQFPTYKKVIRSPMDLSTIKKKLHDCSYKSKDEFAGDVRQIFHNCEVFNEDDSPVGLAGHGMRRFFEERWNL